VIQVEDEPEVQVIQVENELEVIQVEDDDDETVHEPSYESDDEYDEVPFQPMRRDHVGVGDEINENETCCAICLEEVPRERNCATLMCGHKFHLDCMFRNICNGSQQSFQACPLCRNPIPLCDIVHERVHELVNQMVNEQIETNDMVVDQLRIAQYTHGLLEEELMQITDLRIRIAGFENAVANRL